MEAKQKIIMKYYEDIGYGYLFSSSNENGWIRVKPLQYQNENFQRLRINLHTHSIRPKSLEGIEDNNGWTKIDTHSVLPKNGTECWVITKLSETIFCSVYWNESFISGDVVFRLSEATHFQIIDKPKPPIY